jgi:MFS family permease
MPRKLKAVEIAEGALLADIAVVFQLLVIYLPVGGDFFRFPIFIVFAILVLRRGLYVGIMSMCVACFIISIIIGPQYLIQMLLTVVGGLFLGVTMKYRWHSLPLLFIGITCGALALYFLIFAGFFLTGVPFTTILPSLHNAYNSLVALINAVFGAIGLGNVWKHTFYPFIASVAAWGFTYWWLFTYIALWFSLVPVVWVIYMMTNIFVRLLGYNVRPFPDRKGNRLVRRIVRPWIKRMMKRRRRYIKQRISA